jgi:hypothetical protein
LGDCIFSSTLFSVLSPIILLNLAQKFPTGSAQNSDVERLAEFDVVNRQGIHVILGIVPGFMVCGFIEDKPGAAEGFFTRFHHQINLIAGLRAAVAEACYPVLEAEVVVF